MTDLVSQLVGALEGMLKGTQEDCGRITMPRNEAVRAAFAALTAAKAGGWVAVPVEPHGYLYDVYFEDEDGDPAGSKRDNFTRSLKYAKDNGTNVRAVCILPTPPKEQS